MFELLSGRTNLVRASWDRLSALPGGHKIFSKAIGRAAPYTGTIDAEVLELRYGYALVRMEDRKKVRNHLDSIHAIALCNLAEVASGVAFVYSLPDGARGILTGLSIEYLEKARGTLHAECTHAPPETSERGEYEIEVVTRNASDAIVTRASARWLVGPAR